ncbi:MAG: hypothetical protein ABIF10_07165 [Candidatus Woesearchaeota archaeon]
MRKSLARTIGIAAICTQLGASAVSCSHKPQVYKVADELQSVGRAAAELAALLERHAVLPYFCLLQRSARYAKSGLAFAEHCVIYEMGNITQPGLKQSRTGKA